jgi:hypothetical protein
MQTEQEELNESALRVLRLFGELSSETLDLHTILELAGGNDPAEREAVFDEVEALVVRNMLAERGNDYYALTELGVRVTTLKDEVRLPEPIPPPRLPIGRIALYAALATLVLFILLAIRHS